MSQPEHDVSVVMVNADADVNMPAFLTAKNLKPFITKELDVTSSQIEFQAGVVITVPSIRRLVELLK